MDSFLTLDDIEEKFKDKIYKQDYTKKPFIDGATVLPLRSIIGEDGSFCELLRLNQQGEIGNIPGFKLGQVNRTELLGKVIKAWHLHFKQNELWFVNPESNVLVGLLDLRKDSPTHGISSRLILGGGKTELLLIPKGVAHGSANMTDKPTIIWYFIDQQFNPKDSDELRLHWDVLGHDFWEPIRD